MRKGTHRIQEIKASNMKINEPIISQLEKSIENIVQTQSKKSSKRRMREIVAVPFNFYNSSPQVESLYNKKRKIFNVDQSRNTINEINNTHHLEQGCSNENNKGEQPCSVTQTSKKILLNNDYNTEGNAEKISTSESNPMFEIKVEILDIENVEEDAIGNKSQLEKSQKNDNDDYCFQIITKLIKTDFPSLTINMFEMSSDSSILIVYPKKPLMLLDGFGGPYLDYIRLLIKSDDRYCLQVLRKTIQTGVFDYETVKRVLEVMTSNSYGLCSGLSSYFQNEQIPQMADLRKWHEINRIDSTNCFLWFSLNYTEVKDKNERLCRKCRNLLHRCTITYKKN